MQCTTARNTRSGREEEEPGRYSLRLGEGRGFVGLRGPRCVVIGRALILRPHLHDGLFGLIFSVEGERNTLTLKLSQRSVALTSANNGNTDSIRKYSETCARRGACTRPPRVAEVLLKSKQSPTQSIFLICLCVCVCSVQFNSSATHTFAEVQVEFYPCMLLIFFF